MKYYIIRESMNLKIVGHYFQIKETKHNCNVWDEPKFIERHELEKLDFVPITSNGILFPKSKITDLISGGGMGFSRKLLVSGKFKEIIEKNTNGEIKFYNSYIIQKDKVYNDYWVLYPECHYSSYINFNESRIMYRKTRTEGGTFLEEVIFFNYIDFENHMLDNNLEGNLFFEQFAFKDNLEKDFIAVKYVSGGILYLVSEKLKKEIEDTGCTGIEFQPSNISLNDWLSKEREKIYGKT